MHNNITSSGEIKFKPKARLIKSIGEDLISNKIIALIELVKNSYDANSGIVSIKFKGVVENDLGKKKNHILLKENSVITIEDSGDGMDLDIIKSAWMEPATNYKLINKNDNRRLVGEKGIGRFATNKLAKKLIIYSKKTGKPEVKVQINWNDYNNENVYLDEVVTYWEIGNFNKIKNKGTILVLVDLNENWDVKSFKELKVSLSRLMSPISKFTDFLIELNLPDELKELNGLIGQVESLNNPHYIIKGIIDEQGKPTMTYYSLKNKIENKINFETEFYKEYNRNYLAGKFEFEFKIWDRDKKSLEKLIEDDKNIDLTQIKKDLDNMNGISIYRDNIRILPYGDSDYDWLNLNIRRVNNPTLRLSFNQIVGYILIHRDINDKLIDQTNREGIKECQEFTDIKDIIKLILNEVELKRYKERPREKKSITKSIFEKLSIDSIINELENKFPQQNEIIDFVKTKSKEFKEGINEIQEILYRYRRLTTLGQLMDVLLHETGNNLLKIELKANSILDSTKNEFPDLIKIEKKASEILIIKKGFKSLMERMEPFSGKKRGRPQKIIIEQIINNQFILLKEELNKNKINFNFLKTENYITIDESDIAIIFNNLILNSIYWLNNIEYERKIFVEVKNNIQQILVFFSDNGPGINEENKGLIFNPYFSTKPNGIGLGLTIAGEIITEYNGELSLLDNGILDGANFKIIFKI